MDLAPKSLLTNEICCGIRVRPWLTSGTRLADVFAVASGCSVEPLWITSAVWT
jgi:hypothetical protein